MNKIIYLDAAASALKSDSVIAAQTDFLRHDYANAGRGVCARAVAVDDMVDRTRAYVAGFMGAAPHQVVFTSGTTDGMNRIVNILTQLPIFKGRRPTVAVSDLDHHSARMPWENLKNHGRCDLVVCPLNGNMDIDINGILRADVMVITAMSNVMGMPQDVAEIVRAARAKNPDVITIVDAAQFVAHGVIDAHRWDCDFICWSGHKIGADTGLGVMYIKNPDDMPADKFGGGMVNKITPTGEFLLNASPDKFEAGTQPLTQIAGLIPAIEAWRAWGGASDLVGQMYDELSKFSRINLITSRDASLISMTIKDMHVLDFGALMGAHSICLRVGNMCATWIHRALDIGASARLSFGPWNTADDVTYAIDVIRGIVK